MAVIASFESSEPISPSSDRHAEALSRLSPSMFGTNEQVAICGCGAQRRPHPNMALESGRKRE
jgi:hypothetical protein